jgi:hypothetical protein
VYEALIRNEERSREKVGDAKREKRGKKEPLDEFGLLSCYVC